LDGDVEDDVVAAAARGEGARLVVANAHAVQAVVVERREREDAVLGGGEHAVRAVGHVVLWLEDVLADAPAVGRAAHKEPVEPVEPDHARERVDAERRVVGPRQRLGEARRELVREEHVSRAHAALVGREKFQGAHPVVGYPDVARGVVQVAVPELWDLDGAAGVDFAAAKAWELRGHAHGVAQHAALDTLVRVLALDRADRRAHGARLFSSTLSGASKSLSKERLLRLQQP